MATGVITTSLVVNFDAGDSDGELNVEIDDRPDGLNNGDTSFVPGDEVGFLIYKTSNVVIDEITTSLGVVSSQGTGSRSIDEDVTFANETTANAGYPIQSITSYNWIGTNGGSLTKLSETTFSILNPAVAIAKVVYNTTYLAKKLGSIPTSYGGSTTFSVVIFISGHVE